MITLLTPRVWTDITQGAAMCQTPAYVAVAYFGSKGDTLLPLPTGSSIVVDASIPTIAMGSTCPAALDRLRKKGTSIYSAQYLHAKVYAFDSVAFVGSANASRRSEQTLIETILRVDDKATISSARDFVKSLCLTRLSSSDLRELSEYYRPPKFTKPIGTIKQAYYSTLLMELTREQGGNRARQVQPPKAVWQYYFGIMVGRQTLPELFLINEALDPPTEFSFRVVKHDHNYTIEIPGAEMPRPAILQMRRIGINRFSYRVHRPAHPTFLSIKRLVESLPNPLWESGRLWVLI
jgi:hypothetical protein